MEDRLKYRAWLKTENKMIDEFFLCTARDSIIENDFCTDFFSDIHLFEHDLKDLILMQCTGLKDCEKNLIYEGYIVCPENCLNIKYRPLGVVSWLDQDCCFAIKYRDESIQKLGMMMLAEDFKILGNIYEHPELLNEKQ